MQEKWISRNFAVEIEWKAFSFQFQEGKAFLCEMRKIKESTYRVVGIFFLLAFSLYWGGITFCAHSHVVNGVSVVHSHPYKATHSHTSAQLETIFSLSSIDATDGLQSAVGLTPWLMLLAVIGAAVSPMLSEKRRDETRLRAPPCCL